MEIMKMIVITIISWLFMTIGHIFHSSFCFALGGFMFAFAYFKFLKRSGLWKK